MPNCPICGKPGYMGAWAFECPTPGCQNFKLPRPTLVIPLTLTVSKSEGLHCTFNRFSSTVVMSFSDGTEHNWSHIRKLVGAGADRSRVTTWDDVVTYLEKMNPRTVEVINSGEPWLPAGIRSLDEVIQSIRNRHNV